jgi:hypothetical protein
MEKTYTQDNITSLKENEVIVFGSNTEGRHGKGMALFCMKNFGAIYKCPFGLQGKSYAIITKDLQGRKINLYFIVSQIITLYHFAELMNDKNFLITKIGTNLAGFSNNEMKKAFLLAESRFKRPSNVIIPIEFEN